MPENEVGPSAEGRGAKASQGSGSTAMVAEVVDLERYRRRRACRAAWSHLRRRGLTSAVVAAELARIERGEVPWPGA